MAEYANPQALIGPDDLEKLLDDPSIRVVEVDEDTTLYDKGHIRGAISWNWSSDLRDPVIRDFIKEDGVAELLERSGVGEETTVVLYAGNNNWFAAYAYWLLKLRGFDNVKILDGGRKKWELDSRELVQDVPAISKPSKRAKVAGTRTELREIRLHVLEAVEKGGKIFVDVRSPEEFRGELLAPAHLPQEQAQVPGHIPGAINIPWSKAANEDGTFRSADDLAALYSEAGVKRDTEVVAYCRIGERSSHTWFVLRELLGYPKVRNYDGSWTEYGSLVGAPVER